MRRMISISARGTLFVLLVSGFAIMTFALTGCASHSGPVPGPDFLDLSEVERQNIRRSGAVQAKRDFLSWSHRHSNGQQHSHVIVGDENEHIYGEIY